MYTAVDRRTTKNSKHYMGNPLDLLTKAVLQTSPSNVHLLSLLQNAESKYKAGRLTPEEDSSLEPPEELKALLNQNIAENSNRDESVSGTGNGELSRLLIDSVGNLRYVGESSPLSLLSVCRQFFRMTFGESRFTSDPERTHIVDKTSFVHVASGHLPLPPKAVCIELVDLFHINVNSSLYVMDESYVIEHIVNPVYDRPLETKQNKFCLLYLIMSLAMLFKETTFMTINIGPAKSSDYFDHGYNMLRETIEDGKLWLTEAYYIVFFYFQTLCKRSTSWLCLGMAIRNAQALGLHRRSINNAFSRPEIAKHRRLLWRSLYVSDRACSILLGRPLQIIDWDWDDYNDLSWLDPEDNKSFCLVEMSKVATLNGKIVQYLYSGSSFSGSKVENLANELREWSVNLPPSKRVDSIMRESGVISKDSDAIGLLYLHLSQLYGICLLCKPCFLFVIHSHQKNVPVSDRNLGYFNSCVKSSVLTIQLVAFFLEKEQIHRRADLYVIFNCCFMSALVVGMTISVLSTNKLSQEFDPSILMSTLVNADKVLAFYGIFNVISKRYHEIVSLMIDAIRTSNDEFQNAARLLSNNSGANEDPLFGIHEFQNGFGPPSLGISPVLVDATLNAFLLDLGSHDLFYSAD